MIANKTRNAVAEYPAAFSAVSATPARVWASSAPVPATAGLSAGAVSTKAVHRDLVPTIGMTDVVFGQAHRPRRKPF